MAGLVSAGRHQVLSFEIDICIQIFFNQSQWRKVEGDKFAVAGDGMVRTSRQHSYSDLEVLKLKKRAIFKFKS